MTDLLLFLELNFDKLSDRDVFMALLVGQSSSDFGITKFLYDLEAQIGYTYT